MAEYSDIINGVDSSLESFDKEALKAQKRIMEKIQLLAKDLEVDSAGNIKTTIANLKKINSIKAEISRIVCDDRYKEAVTKFCESFQKVYDRQNKYYKEHFAEATLSETAAKKQKLLGQMAIDNTIEGLTGAGVNAQITDKLTDMLKRSVTSGALWTDMVAEMRSYLDPDGDGTGAFAKYAKTYATTAMGQFTGQNNKLMTDAIDTEWFMYVGSDIETTREFCQHLTKKKYIHVSEIPEILKGHIDGHDCAIYAKTGLPQGMIEGTTPENFQVNVGGWNCRHQLLPVAEEAVPEDIRKKFQQAQEEHEQTDYDIWYDRHKSYFMEYKHELRLTGNDPQSDRLKSMYMDALEDYFEYGFKVDVKNCLRNFNNWRVQIQNLIDKAVRFGLNDAEKEARSMMRKYTPASMSAEEYDRAESGGFKAEYDRIERMLSVKADDADWKKFFDVNFDEWNYAKQKAEICGMQNLIDQFLNLPKNLTYGKYVNEFDRIDIALDRACEPIKSAYESKKKKFWDLVCEANRLKSKDLYNDMLDIYRNFANFKDFYDRKDVNSESNRIDSLIDKYRKLVSDQNDVESQPDSASMIKLIEILSQKKIEYKEAKKYDKQPAKEEIIQKICGGDMTEGSCSSAALTYAGNMCGFDVLDFRGGESRSFFSKRLNILRLCESAGGKHIAKKNDITGAHALWKEIEMGKEYYFACGGHAAVIRMVGKKQYEFLELQSATENGWKPLNDDILNWRFGARKSRSWELESFLIDIDLLKKTPQFGEMLGYINTDPSKQQKGASGTIK